MSEEPDDVVGHKTFYDDGRLWHEPLLRAEADAMLAKIEEKRIKREADMPTEKHAIDTFFEAWLRLKEMGWNEAIYCPKDGTQFLVIEAGSTGIHPCFYSGEWPTGYWMIDEGFDCEPSRPVLFKLYPEDAAREKERMDAFCARFREERAP